MAKKYLIKQDRSETEAELNHLDSLLKPKLTIMLKSVRTPQTAGYERIHRELALIEREIIGLKASLRLRNGH